MGHSGNLQLKVVNGDAGYVLEDVPHLTDYIPDLPVRISFSPYFFTHTYLLCMHVLLLIS